MVPQRQQAMEHRQEQFEARLAHLEESTQRILDWIKAIQDDDDTEGNA